MTKRKFITIFVLLTMAIQVLPMQQIAAWLSSGQVNEEISTCANPVKSKPVSDDAHPPYHFSTRTGGLADDLMSGQSVLHRDEALIRRHADEILSPPPNA